MGFEEAFELVDLCPPVGRRLSGWRCVVLISIWMGKTARSWLAAGTAGDELRRCDREPALCQGGAPRV